MPTDPTLRPALCHTARLAVPGYTGHFPAKTNKLSPEPRHHNRKNSIPGSECSDANLMTTRAVRAVPGYKGHVPGKKVEPIMGASFRQANLHAVSGRTCGDTFEPPMPTSGSTTKDLHHVGTHMPGYTGHVAGRKSDNMCAMSTARAAKEGWLESARSTQSDMYSRLR